MMTNGFGLTPAVSRRLTLALALGLFAFGITAVGTGLFIALFWNTIDLINPDGTLDFLTATDALLMTLVWLIVGAVAVGVGVRVLRRRSPRVARDPAT